MVGWVNAATRSAAPTLETAGDAAATTTVHDVQPQPDTGPPLVPTTLLGRVDLNDQERQSLSKFVVAVGVRTEVNMALLRGEYPDLAAKVRRETQLPKEWTTAHLLTSFRQVTSGNRQDLSDQLQQLSMLPGVGNVVNHACGAHVDLRWLESTTAAAGGTFHYVGDYSSSQAQGSLNFTFALRPSGLPADLGGPRVEGEHTRQLRVVVSHAPWRDRKSRRLSSVQAFALVR